MALADLKPLSVLHQIPLPSPKSPTLKLPHIPSKNHVPLHFKAQCIIPVLRPKLALKTSIKQERENPHNPDSLSVAFPSLAFSNTLLFSSTYNVQVVVGDNEPEDELISRFTREVVKAGVFRECKRRRFYENTQDKRKRKAREAARRNRKRRPQAKESKQDKAEESEKEKREEDSDDDNWEFVDVDLPYC